MSKDTFLRKSLTLVLAICLTLPGTALAGGKSGKKNFNAGMKYEVAQQWDLAAHEFALAVAAEPNNAEFRLHLMRAMLNASIMFMKRGEALAEQNDYASAYNAYRQAYAYDQTNELARVKMERMLEMQKAQSGLGEPGNYNRIGNYIPTSADLGPPSKPRSKDVSQLIEFRDTSLKFAITDLARKLGLNVLFDDTFKDNNKFSISLQNVTLAKALDFILLQTKNVFEQLDRRTILIYQDNPTNRQRMERMMVKTFYLGNLDATEARQAIQQFLTPGRQAVVVKQLNALAVRDTPQNLKVMQEFLDSIDKNRSEVVIDVDIYEVSHTTTTQIGNSLSADPVGFSRLVTGTDGKQTEIRTGTAAGLSDLGGIGRSTVGIAGQALLGGALGSFAFLGLPPTTLSLLQSRGNSRLLAHTQVHALDGEQNQTKVGQSVPVRTGTNYGYTGGVPTTTTGGAQGALQSALTGVGTNNQGLFDNIQYKDVGLVIDVTPTITNEGYVQIKMKLESTAVQASGADSRLTPTFTQRSLQTISRVLDGKTAVVAGVQQDTKGDTRASIPVVGMLPFLGRFFSSPRQESSLQDIIITVTPHIIRTSDLKKEDHLARLAGPQTGLTQSIEDLVHRAQSEDEQDRRMIAKSPQSQPEGQFTTGAQITQTTAPAVSPMPKADLKTIPVQAPINQTPQNGGLTPPRSVNTFQPESTPPTSQPPMRKVNLTGNPEQPSATGRPVSNNTPPPSTGNTVEPEETAPVAKRTPPAQSNEGPLPEDQAKAEVSNYLTQPDKPVAPAQVSSAPRPESVERAIKEAREAAAKSGPPASQPTKDFVPPQITRPKEPVPLAVPKSAARPTLKPKSDQPGDSNSTAVGGAKTNGTEAAKPAGEANVGLSLLCQAKQQVGKPFIVVVSVNSNATMTAASLALKFDPALLQLKAVRDGGLLGNHAEIKHQVQGGNLVISLQQAADKAAPASANGKLVVIEFTALSAGQTSIEFNGAETNLTLGGSLSAQITATPARLQISREAVSLLNY